MKTRLLISCLLLGIFILLPVELDAQGRRSRRNKDQSNWPPEKTYSRISLGYALQRVFKKHYDFCGFPQADNRRDYTPPTIDRFLGKRNLRTKVEQADISGGNLMSYIFSADDTRIPLDELDYQAGRVLLLDDEMVGMTPQAREGFDAFVMTRNCSGYLKACLDVGLEPPYAAFKAALETDDQRKSSVLTVAGSFISPLNEVINARNDRTTELMARLWTFYELNPELNGQAYYLTEFDGVMVRHLSSAEANFSTERSLGINISLPLAAKLNSEVGQGRSGELSFSGTDWETIIYADFEDEYQRQSLFRRLPSIADIEDYFANLRPTFTTGDHGTLTENTTHRHFLRLQGLPEEWANAPWELIELSPGIYQGMPRISSSAYDEGNGKSGVEFTVEGVGNPGLFRQGGKGVNGSIPLSYALSLSDNNGNQIKLFSNQELATSLHPVLQLSGAAFDLSKRDNKRYACEWEVVLNIADGYNPVNYSDQVLLDKLFARNSTNELAVQLIETRSDAARRQLICRVATVNSWPLSRINDQKMNDFNLTGEVAIPLTRSTVKSVRPLKAVIAMPEILPEVIDILEVIDEENGG